MAPPASSWWHGRLLPAKGGLSGDSSASELIRLRCQGPVVVFLVGLLEGRVVTRLVLGQPFFGVTGIRLLLVGGLDWLVEGFEPRAFVDDEWETPPFHHQVTNPNHQVERG